MRTSEVFVAKDRFFENYVVYARTRGEGLESERSFSVQGGQFLVILCRRLSWTPLTKNVRFPFIVYDSFINSKTVFNKLILVWKHPRDVRGQSH